MSDDQNFDDFDYGRAVPMQITEEMLRESRESLAIFQRPYEEQTPEMKKFLDLVSGDVKEFDAAAANFTSEKEVLLNGALGQGSNTAVIQEDYASAAEHEAALKKLAEGEMPAGANLLRTPSKDATEAVDKVAAENLANASKQAADMVAAAAAKGAAAEGAPGSKVAEAAKPSDFESAMASMAMPGKRSKQFVLHGDPDVSQRFYMELEARGKLAYRGGQPVIYAKPHEIESLYKEAAAAVAKQRGEPIHAEKLADLKFEGTYGGLLDNLKSRFNLDLGKTHSVMVLGSGTASEMAQRKESFDQFMGKLEQSKFVERDKDGQFIATGKLQDVLMEAKLVVNAYERQKQAEREAERERRASEGDGHGDKKSSKKAAAAESAPAADSMAGKVTSLAAAGRDKLTPEQATSLLAQVDGVRTRALNKLNMGSGDEPTKTLARMEAIVKDIAGGRHGDNLAAQAKDLLPVLETWKKQDIDRHPNGAEGVKAATAEVLATQGSWFQPEGEKAAVKEGDKTSATAAPQEPQSAPMKEAQAGGTTSSLVVEKESAKPAAVESSQVVQPVAASAFLEREAVDRSKTPEGVNKLISYMANPAGSFTHRDHTWNETKILQAANTVARLDADAVSKMAPAEVAKVTAYASWISEKADSGRLPGFDGPGGRELKAAMAEKVAELRVAASGAELPVTATRQLVKADNLVQSMETREQVMSAAAAAARKANGYASFDALTASNEQAGSSAKSVQSALDFAEPTPAPTPARQATETASLASGVAADLFDRGEVSESGAKNLLKNATELTPESLKALDQESQVKTVAAISRLARAIEDGDVLGPVSQLSPAMQKNVEDLSTAAVRLTSAMNRSEDTAELLQQATRNLDTKLSGSEIDNSRAADDKTNQAAKTLER